MPGTADRPFGADPVEAIPLDPPPLARVLAQVRFSPVLGVADERMAGLVQQRLREYYPLVSGEVEVSIPIQLGPENVPVPTPTRIWRYQNEDESWRVSLASNFVALESAAYPGHEVFFDRLEYVLRAIGDLVEPTQVERTGVRYVQRLAEPGDLERIAEFVRPEIVGVCSIANADANLTLCLTQTQASVVDVRLSARWGLLPPDTAIDPIITPIGGASWIMDIDVFDERREPFDPVALARRALSHSRHQYRFFRWAVEPAFLLRFGGDPALVAALGG